MPIKFYNPTSPGRRQGTVLDYKHTLTQKRPEPSLVKGKDRCSLLIHPADAQKVGLNDDMLACVESRAGAIRVPIEITDRIMPGVVSIPHGWGHDDPGSQLRIAAQHAGANSNVLADDQLVDPVSGNAVLNGIPVELAPA